MIQEPKSKLTAESIEPWDLPCVSIDEKAQLPDSPGIYFVIRGRAIVYIGISETSIKSRWASHHRFLGIKAMGGAVIAYQQYCEGDIREVETALIDIFMPKLNNEFVDPIALRNLRVELDAAKAEAESSRLLEALGEYVHFTYKSAISAIQAFQEVEREIRDATNDAGMREMVERHKAIILKRVIPLLITVHNGHAEVLSKLIECYRPGSIGAKPGAGRPKGDRTD
jgi:hypothetical protein